MHNGSNIIKVYLCYSASHGRVFDMNLNTTSKYLLFLAQTLRTIDSMIVNVKVAHDIQNIMTNKFMERLKSLLTSSNQKNGIHRFYSNSFDDLNKNRSILCSLDV